MGKWGARASSRASGGGGKRVDPGVPSSVPPDLESWLHHGVRAEDTGFPPETRPASPRPLLGCSAQGGAQKLLRAGRSEVGSAPGGFPVSPWAPHSPSLGLGSSTRHQAL